MEELAYPHRPTEVLVLGCVVQTGVMGLVQLSPELEQLLHLNDKSLPWETGELSFVSSLTP